MALVKCKECGKEVSTAATSCPHCGAPQGTASGAVVKTARWIWTAAKLFVGLIVLVAVYRCTKLTQERQAKAAITAPLAAATPQPTMPADPMPQTGWTYDSYTDKMTGKEVRTAMLKSTNSMNLDFPYRGPNYGHLLVRSGPKGQTEALFYIDKGQTMCHSYDYDCAIKVRFDDAQPVTFRGIGPSDNSTETAFLDAPSKFVARALKAKHIRVAMNIYQAGEQVLEFEVAEPLRWPPR